MSLNHWPLTVNMRRQKGRRYVHSARTKTVCFINARRVTRWVKSLTSWRTRIIETECHLLLDSLLLLQLYISRPWINEALCHWITCCWIISETLSGGSYQKNVLKCCCVCLQNWSLTCDEQGTFSVLFRFLYFSFTSAKNVGFVFTSLKIECSC